MLQLGGPVLSMVAMTSSDAELSDKQLLAAWRAGERRAGSTLFERHFASVCRFFRNKVSPSEVEELVQGTFTAAVEGRDRFREEASFRTYLFAIAVNLLRAHFRRSAKARARDGGDVDGQSIADMGESPSAALAAKGETQLLLHGLRRIPLEAQVILELYYWEQIKGRELAALLGVKLDTARSRLRRAKRRLADEIARLEATPSEIESTVSNLDSWAAKLREQLQR